MVILIALLQGCQYYLTDLEIEVGGVQEESTEHVLYCLTGVVVNYGEGITEDTNWLRKVRTIFEQFEEENSINIDSQESY